MEGRLTVDATVFVALIFAVMGIVTFIDNRNIVMSFIVANFTGILDSLTVIASFIAIWMMGRSISVTREIEHNRRRPRLIFNFVFRKMCVFAELRNDGLTLAKDVTVEFKDDLPEVWEKIGIDLPFTETILYIASASTENTFLSTGLCFFREDNKLKFSVKISYKDSDNKPYFETINYDLNYMRGIKVVDDVDIGKEVEGVKTELSGIRGIASKVKDTLEASSNAPPPLRVNVASESYSQKALAVARWFVKKSETGMKFDPSPNIDKLVKELTDNYKLKKSDVLEGVSELEEGGFVTYIPWQVVAEEQLFVKFDRFWMDWDTEEDAKKLAKNMLDDKTFASRHDTLDGEYRTKQISLAEALYDLPSRQLNPALCWLEKEKIINLHRVLGTDCMVGFQPSFLRRFVKKYTIDTSGDHKKDDKS